MKKCFILLLVLMTCVIANAEFFEVSGEARINNNVPVNEYWAYSWGRTIYNGEDLNYTQCNITKLSYQLGNDISNFTSNNQTIYIGYTDLSTTASDTSYENPVTAGATEVYSGTIVFNGDAGSWITIELDTAFEYDGSGNIIVYWENRHGVNQPGYPRFNVVDTGTYVSALDESSTSFPGDVVAKGTNRMATPPEKYKPFIRFEYTVEAEPTHPLDVVYVSPSNYATDVDLSPTLDWEDFANSPDPGYSGGYEFYYCIKNYETMEYNFGQPRTTTQSNWHFLSLIYDCDYAWYVKPYFENNTTGEKLYPIDFEPDVHYFKVEELVIDNYGILDPDDGAINVSFLHDNINMSGGYSSDNHDNYYVLTIKDADSGDTVFNTTSETSSIEVADLGLDYGTEYIIEYTTYAINNISGVRTDQSGDPVTINFSTIAGVDVSDNPNANNPVSQVIITSPDGSQASDLVVPETLPNNLPYQSLAAFSYNFDVTGSFNIEFYSEVFTMDWYTNSPHVYANGVELTMVGMKGNVEGGMWAIAAEGLIYLMVNYTDGSKGDVDIVITNNVENQTLPVTLSSFNAVAYSDEYVSINWVTESESNLLGFNVLRAETENVENSVRVNSSMIAPNNTSQTSEYSFVDDEVTAGRYYYWLETRELSNEVELSHAFMVEVKAGEDSPQLPTETLLGNPYPSPFAGNTQADLRVKDGETASVTVYNLLGQVVKRESFSAGNHTFEWNGNDSKGNKTANGIYFFRMTTPSQTKAYKVLKLK